VLKNIGTCRGIRQCSQCFGGGFDKKGLEIKLQEVNKLQYYTTKGDDRDGREIV